MPDKNIRAFCGKPMIAHSIERARASGLFDVVSVSTDSSRIAEVALAQGAEVPFLRAAKLANDQCGIASVIADSLVRYRNAGSVFKYACCLLATAPLITEVDLQNGLQLLRQTGARMCLPVTTFPYCIFRALQGDATGRVRMVWPENLRRNSQEFPEAFHDAGAFYWFDVERFLENPEDFFADAVPLFLPRDRVQDIDTLEDWKVAEQLYLLKHSSSAHE